MKLSLICLAIVASLFAYVQTHVADISPDTGYTHNPAPVGVMPGTIPVFIDKKFSATHKADIKSSVTHWNVALNGFETFAVKTDNFDMEPDVLLEIAVTGQGLVILRRSALDPVMENLPDGVLGWVMMEPGQESHVVNLVEDSIGTRDMVSISMHEIGHTLRIPHIPVKGSLMFPFYPYSVSCVDLVTAQTLATIRGWDWHKLNHCDRPL